MPRIYTIGEAILDIIFREGEVIAARPGGSMLNTSVSLGRLGMEVFMISEVSKDAVGSMILKFLEDNGVNTSLIQQYGQGKTPVSIAMLDADNNANYTFFRELPEERLTHEFPDLQKGDILLFGSFYALDPAIYPKIRQFVHKAREKGAFIIYDPNIRKNHLGDISLWMPHLEENLSMADLVRGSDEDFMNIFGISEPAEIFLKINSYGPKTLVLTSGREGATLFASGMHLHEDAKEVIALSTIGAGDNFNAGLIYALLRTDIIPGRDFVPYNNLAQSMLLYGTEFAANVCMTYDNYISADLAKRLSGKF